MRLPARAAELVTGQVDFIAVCRPRTNPTTNSRSCRVRCAPPRTRPVSRSSCTRRGIRGPKSSSRTRRPAARSRRATEIAPPGRRRSRNPERSAIGERHAHMVRRCWRSDKLRRAGRFGPGLSNNADYDNMLDGHHAHRQRAVRNVLRARSCAKHLRHRVGRRTSSSSRFDHGHRFR